MENIKQLHEDLFLFLEDLRESNRDQRNLRYTFRKDNFGNKLTNGYWFLGDEKNLIISFWSGDNLYTKKPNISINFELETSLIYLDITIEKATSDLFENNGSKFVLFHDFILPDLYDLEKQEEKDFYIYRHRLGPIEFWKDILSRFIINEKNRIDDLIINYQKQFESEKISTRYSIDQIDEDLFNRNLRKIKRYRDQLIDLKEYENASYYNKQKPFYIKSSNTTNSKGETLTTEYQYPPDLTSGYEQSSLMEEMIRRNMIANPVITTSKNGSIVLSEQRTLYKFFPGTNGTLILPEFVYVKKGATTTAADRKITYNSYDKQGNLTQYTLENGLPVSIIWGYNNQYPVAKLEGVALSQINGATITTLNTKTTDADLLTALTSLRTAHKDAMVTGYLYKPLIGVTQIIQPNGVSEKYNYDSSNRLQSIVNDKNEVLKTFQYNYKP